MVKNLVSFLGAYLISFVVSADYFLSPYYTACSERMLSGKQSLCFVDGMIWWLVEVVVFIPWLLITIYFLIKPRIKTRHPRLLSGFLVCCIGFLLLLLITYLPLPSVLAGMIFG